MFIQNDVKNLQDSKKSRKKTPGTSPLTSNYQYRISNIIREKYYNCNYGAG